MKRWLLFCVALLGCQDDVYVEVNCQSTGVAYNCTVEHKTGSISAEACWDIFVTCANGSKSSAHACQRVDPRSKATRIVPYADFTNATKCDAASSVSVANLHVGR